MGRSRKPKVNFGDLNQIADRAVSQPLSDEEHHRLKAALRELEGFMTPADRPSEKAKDLFPGTDQQPISKGPRRGGRGRNGSDEFSNASKTTVPHESLKSGDTCPECQKGKLYNRKDPGVLWRFVAQALVAIQKYELERLKCNICDAIFTASPPPGVGEDKYDESVPAALAVCRYGAGIPSHRLEQLMAQFRVPLPHSTQWELVSESADLLQPLVNELIRQAADSSVIHTDDTSMRVLEQKRHLPAERTGTFTTGMVTERAEGRIALYFTGEQHCGENLSDLLRHRAANLPKPVVMFDASSRNRPKEDGQFVKLTMANCMSHARRNFVDVLDNFPSECRHLVVELGRVFAHDAQAKELGFDAQARLTYHQTYSEPILTELQKWSRNLFEQKLVEPNSGLGKALQYLDNHWTPLTEFLRTPGCPISNNICERAIKKMVLYRKNSLFYRNENGSSVGDVYMSIIHTCELNGVPAFEYLVALLRNADLVQANPGEWLPWTYRDNLAEAPTFAASTV